MSDCKKLYLNASFLLWIGLDNILEVFLETQVLEEIRLLKGMFLWDYIPLVQKLTPKALFTVNTLCHYSRKGNMFYALILSCKPRSCSFCMPPLSDIFYRTALHLLSLDKGFIQKERFNDFCQLSTFSFQWKWTVLISLLDMCRYSVTWCITIMNMHDIVVVGTSKYHE